MDGPRRFSEVAEVSDATLAVVKALGFDRMTPVQDAVIPLFCGHKDVAVDACTGSGKTLAFIIPIVEKLRRLEDPLRKHQVGAVIVSPTRELARQIYSVASPFVASLPGVVAQLLVGGADPGEDVAEFKASGAQLLVGTPGRLDDIMKRCTAMDFKRLEVLVLDEADRLLDMGFRQQLDAIMARLPKQRRTGLFSATQTEAVQALARAGLRNPIRVNVAVSMAAATAVKPRAKSSGAGPVQPSTPSQAAEAGGQKTPSGLHIQYCFVEVDQKLDQLVRFLQLHATSHKIIVYCLTCACVDFYHLALKRLGPKLLPGLQVKALHGRMKQSVREATLASFSPLSAGVLLATDLAARGLDIPEVHWVLQVDPPQDPAAFVHRVGRTARAGRSGHALVLLAPHEAAYVDFIRLRKVPLSEVQPLEGAAPLLQLLRQEAETDREVMEAGSRAFVSYVRGYKEHHCKFIFRVQDLPLGRLASSFALLRLPHMPEVKRALHKARAAMQQSDQDSASPPTHPSLDHFVPSAVEPDSIRFKDKAREKQRQQMLKQRAAAAAEAAANKPATQKARPKLKAGAGAKPATAEEHGAGERLTGAKRRKLQARDEVAELAAEYSLLKRMKKGKISEHEFDVATGLVSGSEDEDEPLDAESDLGDDGLASSLKRHNANTDANRESSQGGGPKAGKGTKRKSAAQKDGALLGVLAQGCAPVRQLEQQLEAKRKRTANKQRRLKQTVGVKVH
ncbi:DEAD-domain-containing protein [Haematococcus lacustris]